MSEQSGYPGAPPGWYPDPAGGPGQRWWDGYAWTDATVLPEYPPPPPSEHAAPSQGPPNGVSSWAVASDRRTAVTESRVNDELRIASAARFAVVMPAVYYLVQLISVQVNSSAWRSVGHELRVAWDAAQAGRPAPQYHTETLANPFTLVVGLATIAAVVVACIWQHRAATTARALGFPSRRSPAWGVGAWFVPVVNLWIPYGAIRDCLPAGDPQRIHVLRWWISWLIGVVLSGTASLCALFSTGVALAVSVPAAIALLAVMAWAPGVVVIIAVAHRRAISTLGQDSGAFPR